VYEPFNMDFGPLNLSMTYRFCTQLERLLEDPRYKYQLIVHYCSSDPAKLANAAYLMGAFALLVLKRPSAEIWSSFASSVPLVPFRDAGFGGCSYDCTMEHCLGGLESAVKLGWFSVNKFNIREYEHFEKVENGDLNWVIPNKFIAFSSPADNPEASSASFSPSEYVPIFKKLGVTCVVRLNTSTYDPSPFIRNGIKHYDLYFLDGSVPSDEIVRQFLDLSRLEPGAIAVHCKAGLGRTGTLIGCYAISKRLMKAEDYIAWARICRPGSVLGPQQKYLIDYEQRSTSVHSGFSHHQTTPEDRVKARYGDLGQGSRLMSAKRLNQSASTTPVKTRPEPQQIRYKENTRVIRRESASDVFSRYYTKTPADGHRRAESSPYQPRSPYSFVTRN
jgi:cell division cycle 14